MSSNETSSTQKYYVPIWEKQNLSLNEASAYSGIVVNTLRRMCDYEGCPFVMWVGNKRLIKRKKFDEYIDKAYSVEEKLWMK